LSPGGWRRFALLAISLVFTACGGSGRDLSPAVLFEKGGDLFAASVDGSRVVPLTTTPAFEFDPAVSPDGRTIAFSRQRARDEGISTMSIDGSHRSVVTHGPDISPSWSGDGRTIYFIRLRTYSSGASCGSIFGVSLTEGRTRRVTNTAATGHSHHDPAVSPDGRRIAFSDWDACEGGTSSPRLRVVDTHGGQTPDLAKLRHNGYFPDPEHSSPAWSPDGKRLAFLKNTDLTIANRDGSGEHRVARGGHTLVYEPPAWSPDGRWIAFERASSRSKARCSSCTPTEPDSTSSPKRARS
jgi:Tol biopolymer transport system component